MIRQQANIQEQILEQLNGCQSLFSAIERQVLLRCANLAGVVIISLWALSPLGGQSALRSLTQIPRVIQNTAEVRYAPIELANTTKLSSASGATRGSLSYGPMYLAALMATQDEEYSPMDIWGNLKIPSLGSLSLTDGDYHSVDHTRPVEYTSLLGLPLRMARSVGNSSFDVTSRYWNVACFDKTYLAVDGWDRENGARGSFVLTRGQIWTNTTASGQQSFDLLSLTSNGLGDGPDGMAISVINCTLSTSDVISKVQCIGKECRVDGMRASDVPMDQRPGNDYVSILNTWNMFPKVHTMMQTGSIVGSSVTEHWIMDPTADVSQEYEMVNISALPLEVISSRLQKLYNTFWQSTFMGPLFFGNLTTGHGTLDNISTPYGNISFASANAELDFFDGMQYYCRWGFALTLCAIASLLSILAFASLGLRTRILAPDVFGYASTVLRDNKYAMNDPKAPSHLDGIDATRKMRDVYVMLGDVAKDQVVGHIAFATAEARPQRLRKERHYD